MALFESSIFLTASAVSKIEGVVLVEVSRMDFTRNFGIPDVSVKFKRVFQDTDGTSKHWRSTTRTWHPLTKEQFESNNFNPKEHVKLRVNDFGIKTTIEATIANIIQYDMAKKTLGSYNMNDTFNNIPFTHVLILDHPIWRD